MALALIPQALMGQSRWVVKVTRDGTDEDRRLYDNGKEVRRWQVSWNLSGTEKVERESADGKLAARRVFDAAGSLLREEEYQAGKLSRITRCFYEGGRLSRRQETDAYGKVVATETYLYSDNGRLREVRRRTPEGATDVSAWVAGRSGLSEQRSIMDGSVFVQRYDPDGRLVDREKLVNGTLASVEAFVYASSGKLQSSSEQRPAEAAVIQRDFDAEGRLAQETTRVQEVVRETSTWEYDAGGKVTARTRRGPDGLEVWKYSYADTGDLSREEYIQRGVLVKATIYGEGKHRTEELYRQGEVFLKVFFDGDTRLREEVYADGAVVRTRDYP